MNISEIPQQSFYNRAIRKALKTITPRNELTAELGQQFALESMPFNSQTVVKGFISGRFFTPHNSKIYWQAPPTRAVVPINDFHVPKNIKRLVRQNKFEVRHDTSFEKVMRMCADRDEDSWIDDKVINVYLDLHKKGLASSVESWQDGELVGGLYGIRIGSYFATESQFHTIRDAGKIAFVALFEQLKLNGYMLHDVQFMTPYLEQFGAIEMLDDEFQSVITDAVVKPAGWF